MIKKAEETYQKISEGVNTFSRKKWESTISEVFKEDATLFSCLVLAQYARMDGQIYPDYSHQEHGYRNPENCCSIMADARNDQAIRKCSEFMQDKIIGKKVSDILEKANLKPLAYEELNQMKDEHEMMMVLSICIMRLHRTLQQSMVQGGMNLLKSNGILPEDAITGMFMI